MAVVLVIAAIVVAYNDSYGSNAAGIIAGMLIPLLPIMSGVGMVRLAVQRGGRHGTRRLVIGLLVIAVALAVGVAILSYNIGLGPAILPALVPSLLAGLASFGFSWLQAPSKEGRKVMDQIEGFREYLSVAEEDRLEYLNPPKKTPELFEKFLPYAIALDVENSWAKKFTGVLAAAGVGAAVSSWYTGDEHTPATSRRSTDRLGDEPVEHHLLGGDGAGVERRQQQRQRLVGRRLLRWRRRRWRRIGVVGKATRPGLGPRRPGARLPRR